MSDNITEEEVLNWCNSELTDCTASRLSSILNGDYNLKEALEDILSLRGTKWGLEKYKCGK